MTRIKGAQEADHDCEGRDRLNIARKTGKMQSIVAKHAKAR